MNRVVLLTGERGIGKTRVCQHVVQLGRERGLECTGLLSPPVFADDEKVAINLADVATGEERLLAVADEQPGDIRWGKYRFVPATLDWGAEVLRAATPSDLFIVDELGPLELVSGSGLVEALDVLERGAYQLGLVVIRPELLEELRGLLRRAEPLVLRVTLSNRDRFPEQILSMLDQVGAGADLPRQ